MALTDAPPPQDRPRRSPLYALLPYTTTLLVIVALWVAWTFYSRRQANLEAQRQIDAKKEEARQRVVRQIYGSGEVRFTAFSAAAGTLRRGDKTQLCYGVVNAKNVKIDPPVEALKPTFQHCFDIAPKTTTKYTITADDGAGHSKSESLTVRVQ